MRFRCVAWSVALFLALAGRAAADVVLIDESGTTDGYSNFAALPGAGKYRLDLSSSVPVYMELQAAWLAHWDVFVAPPPKPHAEALEGNTSDRYAVDFNLALRKSASLTFVIPETEYEFFLSDAIGHPQVPGGTLLYRETKFIVPSIQVLAFGDPDPILFSYQFTLTRLAAVPEPGTWLLLVGGFGALGAVLRQSANRHLGTRPATA